MEKMSSSEQIVWFNINPMPPLDPLAIPPEMFTWPIPHVKIKSYLDEVHKSRMRSFKKGLKLTNNIDEYVFSVLSTPGVSFKQDGFLSLPFTKWGYSRHYKKGYLSAFDDKNPYLDDIEYPRIDKEKKFYSQPVWDFIMGYLHSINDQYILKFTSKAAPVKKSKPIQPTILTLLLEKWFENGCKPLNKNQVTELAKKSKFQVDQIKKRWYRLIKDHYSYNEKTQSIREFFASYTYLLQTFPEGSNPHNLVKNKLALLKDVYRDLDY